MRRALTILGVLSLLTTLLVAGPATAQKRTQQGIRIVEDDATDAPAFVTGLDEPALQGKPAELARSHLSANRSLYEIDAPAADLEVISVERGVGSSTVRFQQLYNGLEVFGAHYLVHFDERGPGREITAVNGDFFTDLNTSVETRISQSTARKLALARLRGINVEGVENHGLVVLPDGGGVTAFHFTLWGQGHRGPVRQQVFISVKSGAQVLSYNDLHHADPVGGSGVTVHGETVDLSLSQDGIVSPYEMRGFLDPNEDPPPPVPPEPLPLVAIETHDAQGEDGLLFETDEQSLIAHSGPHFDGGFTNIGAVDAHWGTERVFEFYKSLGRNSIDGEGGEIVSVVNAGDTGNTPMYNAFWDGTKMVYGNPEPNPISREVYPFSADLDIVAHELTHGVIDNSADFVYLNQSGAMNEAYADYFGNAADVTYSGMNMNHPKAGYIAEDLCRVPNPDNWDCPLRDLNDGRDVDDFGFYLVDFDNGGVHLNSTIFSGALWDIRETLDPALADELMYTALTKYGNPLDDFHDGRNALIAASTDVGLTTEERDVIFDVFNARGITNGWDDSPGESDSRSLLRDVTPLGFYNAAPQVSGSRYVVGTYADKQLMFEEPQEIVVGNTSGRGSLTKVNNSGAKVVYDELPDISGPEVVWARGLDVGGGDVTFDVVKRKLGGGMRTIAATSALEWFPSIDGNLIAWESLRSTTDIWARRVGGLPKRMTSGGGDELFPQVSGNQIAWWDLGGGNRSPRIGIKDFKTGKKTSIQHSNPNAFLGPPALNDTHVFWFQDVNNDGFGSIMRAKMNGKRKRALVSESNKDIAPFYEGITLEPPRISANSKFLVYAEEYGYDRASEPENIGRDVWHMAVTGGTPRVVTCNRGDQAYASIGNGRRAVWLDGSLGRTDLMTRAGPRTSCQRTLTRG
jgi:Zn-dependent metalloprotease